MTRERINDFKEIVLPSISKLLLNVDYEGQGKCDAEEFTKDFNEILDLVTKALEQESCDDTVSRGVFEQVMWERNAAIEQLRELGYELGQKIEPCEDCVSRQALLRKMNTKTHEYGNGLGFCKEWVELINSMPPVLPKRKQGEWIEKVHNFEKCWAECSVCGKTASGRSKDTGWGYTYSYTDYCPNCGARMESEESDERKV